MMGQTVGQQDRLFYEFYLEDRVPANHLLRRIDAVLDLNWLRAELIYSHTECPSVDAEPMIRMLLVGYCHSIRFERRLCQEVEFNLAYRWFCWLGLEDRVPNHPTFSVNRLGRFRDNDILRLVFENVVRRCMEADMVFYDRRGFELAPLNDAVQQLVFSERGFSVKTVLVGGDVV